MFSTVKETPAISSDVMNLPLYTLTTLNIAASIQTSIFDKCMGLNIEVLKTYGDFFLLTEVFDS